ncbi:FAD-dependent oxidoreductase [Vibrio sp. TH_r3]|uniref:FAD-dependent oxidoreductase n=1 Tax=Vibrio sp. TH_r3 TaxID=3082084 RepID=UPI00295472BE|nr:FAD-dependent oxidoreductase [Vibrio sp. TH_r3]MDV7105593.1 FAD-dependent oxidoreductase [Vibrio sp. TH_r3]
MEIFARDSKRTLREANITTDLVVAGGGLAGVCAAISAAREGISVALIQDRPVLGGNASSEVRLWALGATSHMGNNNRFARESGVMGEILEENLFRNKEGNPVIFDMILLDLVKKETNIGVYLNTAIFDADIKTGQSVNTIQSLKAFNSINETKYSFSAPLFCDCTGDGIVGHLSGASYRIGSEDASEFDEKMSPDDSFGKKLGHSIYFYTKRTENPVEFTAPTFALDDITDIPRYKRLSSNLNGCDLWWLEWGGRLDTIGDSETIKWELWRIVWGVWDYIKNSGEFEDAANLTLEWVGTIPGKRESRRFVGEYMLTQKDIVEQIDHYDAVSFGGWSIDLHPADGVYSKHDGCRQFHSKGTYTIPYRTMITKNVDNLFFGGRTISASHVAFGSTRVMCTCGQNGQVLGTAAALCLEFDLRPIDLAQADKISLLQQTLISKGFYIPRLNSTTHRAATMAASSTLSLTHNDASAGMIPLNESSAIMLPLLANESLPSIELQLNVIQATELKVDLLVSNKHYNHTPETIIKSDAIHLNKGHQTVEINFNYAPSHSCYVFLKLTENADILVLNSKQELPGLMTVYNTVNPKVAKRARQIADGDWGVDEFDFWLPKRRPYKVIPTFKFSHPLKAYSCDAVNNGFNRPSFHSHAWIPSPDDKNPSVTLELEVPCKLSHITVITDNDFDHAMETSQWGHTEKVAPNCLKNYDIYLDGKRVFEVRENYLSVNILKVKSDEVISTIELVAIDTHGGLACIYAINAYEK